MHSFKSENVIYTFNSCLRKETLKNVIHLFTHSIFSSFHSSQLSISQDSDMVSLRDLISIHLLEDIFLITSALLSIADISIFTSAVVASLGVSTSSINITAVGLGFAFVYI